MKTKYVKGKTKPLQSFGFVDPVKEYLAENKKHDLNSKQKLMQEFIK